MLLPDNIHPEQSIYFNGAFVLKALKETKSIDFLDLYTATKEFRMMSLPVFSLSLDWLFLLNLVEVDRQGKLVLCS